MQLSVLISISISSIFLSFFHPRCCVQRSGQRSPCRDSSKLQRSFSCRPEVQGGPANPEHSEKVLLSLEEVKVRNRLNLVRVFRQFGCSAAWVHARAF